MKKNEPHRFYKLLVCAMRIQLFIIVLICSATMLALADARAQDPLRKTITIELKDAPLKEALDKVAKEAGVKFLYSDDVAKSTTKINASAHEITVGKWLADILQNIPYSYRIVGDALLVRYDEAKFKALQLKQRRKAALPVKGRIVDSKGEPLPGATVRVKGTETLAITDKDGLFQLQGASTDDILIISFVGYKSKEIKVADINANGSVVLEEDAAALKEVVVSTGYQEVPLERATGSFSKVDNALYNREVSTDVISRLKAIAPTLLFDERNGTTKLSIRGRSTIFANDQPLIVVDNFPYDGDIININPNDVESISILKDAAAASIWGVRAGNGVIVITTKRGRKNQAPQLELNANVTVGNKPDQFYKPQMNSADFIDVEKFLFSKGFYDASIANKRTFPVLTPVVELLAKSRAGDLTSEAANEQINALKGYDVRNDIDKYLYRKSINQQYALNLKGGAEKYTYYFSAGYDKNLNNAVASGFDRLVLNSQQTFVPLKNLELTTGLVYTQSNVQANSAVNLSMGAKNIYPYAQLADANGNPLRVARDFNADFINSAQSKGLLDWSYKPLQEVKDNSDKTTQSDMRFSGIAKYTFIKGLSASLNYQYERQNTNNTLLQGENAYYTRNLINSLSSLNGDGTVNRIVPVGGILTNGATLLTSQNGRGQLNFDNNWNKSRITAIAGAEVRQAKLTSNQGKLYGYDAELGLGQPVNYTDYFRTNPSGFYSNIPGITSVSTILDRFRSYFANGAYTYDDRYTLSVSGRIDQSNLFGVKANQRSVPLWSSGVKWDIDKESFYKVSWLPTLSLRASYGYNGNYDNTVTAFTTAYLSYNVYTQQTAAAIQSPPNENLRWEKSGILNIGVDFASQNNRLTGSIEYYHKKGTDLIGNGPLDPTTGFTQFKGNVAGMSGKGLDLIVNTKNITGKFGWQSTIITSIVNDKITDYKLVNTIASAYLVDASITSNTYGYSPVVGRPLFGIYAYKWAGLDPQTGDPMGYLNGKPSKDYGTLNNIAADSLQYIGRATPSLYGAFRNTFSYAGISLSFNISYRYGYYFRRSSIYYTDLFNRNVSHSDFEKRWQKPGDEISTNVPSMVYPANSNRDYFYNKSTILIDKGDNIRLQDISLAYDLSPLKLRKLRLNHLQVYAYMNNVGLLWTANKDHIDPDYPNMTLPRTIAVGIRAGF
ncbi:SusC/RagA family TonB-linked outer membrane protein [Mucilaginibacter sp. Mucisp86]|uniref:SusC/RagA family TonB-linked outer membrane protein n=1 Tax=Mucilaginibacter sp. Mucisp86 TaxID=3243060 RepID=UPI0039B38D84